MTREEFEEIIESCQGGDYWMNKLINASLKYTDSLEQRIAELEEDVRQRECLEIDATATIRSLRECIIELEAPRTCEGCIHNRFGCDSLGNAVDCTLTKYACNRACDDYYEPKDIK